jgi:hypothetical protein
VTGRTHVGFDVLASRRHRSPYLRAPTAAQIIDEIKSLSPEEQAGVVRFVYQLDAERKLSGPEPSALAERLVAADPVEASRVGKRLSAVSTARNRMPKIIAAFESPAGSLRYPLRQRFRFSRVRCYSSPAIASPSRFSFQTFSSQLL